RLTRTNRAIGFLLSALLCRAADRRLSMSGRSAPHAALWLSGRLDECEGLHSYQKSLSGSRVARNRSGCRDAVHPRCGAAVECRFFRRRGTRGNTLEGVPQLGVAARLLVRRKIAFEH